MIPIFLLLFALAAPSFEQTKQVSAPKSPCPNVFHYEPTTEPDRWYGVIYLSTDTTLHSVWLNVILDNKAKVLGNWLGSVNTEDYLDFEVTNRHIKINPGAVKIFRFFVEYSPINDTPRVKAIRLNGREICNASIHQDQYDDLPLQTNRPSPETSSSKPQMSPEDIRVTKPGQSLPDDEKKPVDIQNQCGKTVLNRSKRTINGTTTLEGQWPWHVAIYQTVKVNNKYICGGTLVSHRHVITAAHCVSRRGNSIVADINTLNIHLGKVTLDVFSDGVQIRYLEKVTVDPEYNATAFSRDIAIIELKEPARYTDWVQPACLWPEDLISITNIIGRKGSVAGWGFDDSGKPTRGLKIVELSIVDTETCIRSFVDFYARFVTDYNYCAGSKEASLCNGDSGGGMLYKIGDTWYLRGLLSIMVSKPDKATCDPTYNPLFTDITKFLPWIRSIVYDL